MRLIEDDLSDNLLAIDKKYLTTQSLYHCCMVERYMSCLQASLAPNSRSQTSLSFCAGRRIILFTLSLFFSILYHLYFLDLLPSGLYLQKQDSSPQGKHYFFLQIYEVMIFCLSLYIFQLFHHLISSDNFIRFEILVRVLFIKSVHQYF